MWMKSLGDVKDVREPAYLEQSGQLLVFLDQDSKMPAFLIQTLMVGEKQSDAGRVHEIHLAEIDDHAAGSFVELFADNRRGSEIDLSDDSDHHLTGVDLSRRDAYRDAGDGRASLG